MIFCLSSKNTATTLYFPYMFCYFELKRWEYFKKWHDRSMVNKEMNRVLITESTLDATASSENLQDWKGSSMNSRSIPDVFDYLTMT